jgi:membrane protein
MQDRHQEPDKSEKTKPRYQKLWAAWRARYEGSFAQDLLGGLGAVDFGDRIIIFGACLLLSVLPLIIVLSAFASHRIQDDIARHLGLSAQGTRVVEGLFKASVTSFNLAIFVGLLLSFAGTIAVARSVEVIYERAFDYPPLARAQGWLRCLVWVVVISGALIADGAIERTLIDDVGHVVFGLVELALFTLFFWWSAHFLLGGRASWRQVRPAAIATGLLWIGLGVFAAFYFSSTIVSDSKTYGTIGVTFTLVTWFIAIGAVLTLGAVVGAVWQRRRSRTAKSTLVSGERSDPGIPRSPEHLPGTDTQRPSYEARPTPDADVFDNC